MKNAFWHTKVILKFFPLFIAVFLAGCGGGGSSTPAAPGTYISGTAAAGAPVIGYVSVRDSSANTQPVKTNIPIEANGHYSIDVSGLTPPYAFLADGTVGGKRVTLYSAATSADEGNTINITPFTDLIIRNIAASAVDAYLSNPANMTNLTTAQLDAQRVALTNALAPALAAMGVSTSIDLLRATFNADSTGLDRFMDVVKVDATNPGAVTITSILDAATSLIIDTTASTTTISVTGSLSTAGMDPTATPLDLMLATSNAFAAFFATSLPDPNDQNLLDLFSSTFLLDGQDAPAFLTEITTGGQNIIGLKFTNLVVDSIDAASGIAYTHAVPVNAAGDMLARDHVGGAMEWQMKFDSGTSIWQMNGNQHIAGVRVNTTADRNTCNPANTSCTTATTYGTGLHLDIDNRGLLAIGSAVVTGNGLPVGGVTLAMPVSQTWFDIVTPNPINPCNGCSGNDWFMTDTEIAAVTPNSTYTVTLYDNTPASAVMATYTEVVPVAPVTNAVAQTLSYPSISGMVNLNSGSVTTATLTPSWSIPAGLKGDWLNVYVWQSGSNDSLNVGTDIFTSTGTSTLVISAPQAGGSWTGGNYWINARDQFGGRVNTNYQ